jgi:hypothetical protein
LTARAYAATLAQLTFIFLVERATATTNFPATSCGTKQATEIFEL